MKRPNLPAIRGIEAKAFDFACRFLTEFRDSDSPWGSASLLDPKAGDDFWRDNLRRIVRWPSVTNRLQLLAIARSGDAIAIEVANEFINEMRSLGAKLPIEFEAFSMDVHAGLIVPHAPQGPPPRHRFVRNMMIATAVAAVMDKFGLPHTRRRKSRSGTGRPSPCRSASAIVADAVRKVTAGAIDLGEAAVEKIYESMAGGMPDRPGWATTIEKL
jgi:hypothetical protein